MIAAARRWSHRPPEGRATAAGRISPAKPRPRTRNAGRPGRRPSPATRGRWQPRRGESAVSAPPGRSGATPPALPRAGLRRTAVGVRRGRVAPPRQSPLVRTRGRLAMTLNRCHGQFCAREVFSPRQPLPCGLAGRCAGVIDVARALCRQWSAAATGRLFPGVTRSPLSVVLAALSPMRRAAWSRSCPCSLPTWSVRSLSRSLVSVDTCCSSRSIGSCA